MHMAALSKFQKSLYSGKDIPDVLTRYEKELRHSNDLIDTLHANKIMEYRTLIINKSLLFRIRRNFNEIYKLIDHEFPEIKFSIDGRRKSLVSVEKKINKLLAEERSLDLLRDIYAFRITLFGSNSLELVNKCYKIANAIIEHSLKKGITLCEAEITQGTEFISTEHPEVIIPKKSGIIKHFQKGVKDYILTPKQNGYQSLHLLFRATTGECFEVQIRTFGMHLHAETGDASHETYKNKKYVKQNLEFDPKKINIPGFGVATNGKIFDMIGLQNGLEILKRQKTY